jgi:predicted nucleic acid-binding protein
VPDNYLLDTNILSFWYADHREEHAKVLARVQAVRQPDPQTEYVSRLFISVVTLGEIEQGHRSSPTPNASVQAEYMAFVREQCPEPLEITKHVAVPYGDLKAWLFDQKKRTKIERAQQLVDPASAKELHADENDIWIAAQAMTLGLVLVTHDSRGKFRELQQHFKPTLRVEDWAQ